MKKLICSACVAVLASLVPFDVCSMNLWSIERPSDVRRPVSESIARDFVIQCLGKPVTKISEIKEWEYNLDKGIYGAPQLFRAESEGVIVRTIDKTKDKVKDQSTLDGGFSDFMIWLIK